MKVVQKKKSDAVYSVLCSLRSIMIASDDSKEIAGDECVDYLVSRQPQLIKRLLLETAGTVV